METGKPAQISPQIEESWKIALADEFKKPYFLALKQFLVQEKQQGHQIFPPGKLIFNAFNSTPFDQVKVVIIGQDPYHGPGQAHGLCFSVQHGVKPPPSLKNIYKELLADLGVPTPNHGNLEKWTAQGVLLINAMLTVRARTPASHQKKGWEEFTDAVIKKLNDEQSGIVFICWGRYAQNKANFIDPTKHHVLKSAHPSPFSAHSGFFGSKPFSQTNKLLTAQGKEPIDWSLD